MSCFFQKKIFRIINTNLNCLVCFFFKNFSLHLCSSHPFATFVSTCSATKQKKKERKKKHILEEFKCIFSLLSYSPGLLFLTISSSNNTFGAIPGSSVALSLGLGLCFGTAVQAPDKESFTKHQDFGYCTKVRNSRLAAFIKRVSFPTEIAAAGKAAEGLRIQIVRFREEGCKTGVSHCCCSSHSSGGIPYHFLWPSRP